MKSAKSATRSREDDAEVNSTEPGDLLWGVAASLEKSADLALRLIT
jgi:hypothetical protein